MHILGIDPGSHGSIVYGDSIESTTQIDYPQNPKEWANFGKSLWVPGSEVFMEKIITSAWRSNFKNTWHQKAANLAAMSLNHDKGCWYVALAPWWSETKGNERITELAPQTWRKIIFGKANLYSGSMSWKRQELYKAREIFPHLNWKKNRTGLGPKNDAKIYGLSASCLIWLAGAKIKGMLEDRK